MEEFFTQKDKLQHILISALLMVWFRVLLAFPLSYKKVFVTLIAAGIVLLIGATKEVVDHFSKKRVASTKDFIADCIGVALVFLPLIFI